MRAETEIEIESLAEQIQVQRRALGMRVQELSEKTGYSVGTVRAWEQGRRNPSLPALDKLEAALETTFNVDRAVLAPMPGGDAWSVHRAREKKKRGMVLIPNDNPIGLSVNDMRAEIIVAVMQLDESELTALHAHLGGRR